MSKLKLKTKVLVDGGDPQETVRVRNLLGYVDGQTTNPTLISKNPEVRKIVSSGRGFSSREELEEYKRIVRAISPLVGEAGVSIEVFSDLNTTAEQMVDQGVEMFSWISNAYIKYPCTHEGLRAAQMSARKGLRVNMTLCFSQEQAAAVYAATVGSRRRRKLQYCRPVWRRIDQRLERRGPLHHGSSASLGRCRDGSGWPRLRLSAPTGFGLRNMLIRQPPIWTKNIALTR
jgi:transaldolase